MKRLLFIFLAFFLLSGCEARTETTKATAPIQQISDEQGGANLSDYLPDFPVYQQKSYGADYQNVTVAQVQSYIDKLKADGFTYEGNDYDALLFKEDALIEIYNSDAQNQQCSVTVALAQDIPAERIPTCEEFQRKLQEPGIFYVLEQTPAGFFEETGTRLFLAATKYTWESDSTTYNIFYVLVSPNGMLPLNTYNNIAPPICRDLDGDGHTEILTLGYGPTSGLFTFTLRAYTIADEAPVLYAQKTYMADPGYLTIDAENDGVSLYHTPNSYDANGALLTPAPQKIPIHLENHKFSLETTKENAPEPWLEFAADYKLLVTSPSDVLTGLNVYVWAENGVYWCGLTARTQAPATAAELNSLCPVTLEEMRELLALYDGAAENIAVYFIERPVLSDDYEAQTEGVLSEELRRQLLGSA